MQPTVEELRFVRRHLEQMRLPRRGANLDDLDRSLAFLLIVEQEGHGDA